VNWTEQAVNLLREIAADDLNRTPVYVIDFAEVATYEPRLRFGSCEAWTGPLADLLVADFLHRSGRWQGRGFATVIHGDRLPTWQARMGAAVHELAHYLETPQTPANELSETEVLKHAVAFLKAVPQAWSDPSQQAQPPATTLPPWHDHGSRFVRSAAILAHRTERLIESIRPRMVRFSRAYLGPKFTETMFVDALDEQASDPRPIRKILEDSPPKEFLELWELATFNGN
jgi:hypothetical protein